MTGCVYSRTRMRAWQVSAALAAALMGIFGHLDVAGARHAETRSRPSQGALLIATERAGDFEAMPLRQTSVTAYIAGSAAQVRVQQTFNNPFDRPLEAIYVFPLPDDAAVSDMKIRIGQRTIRGLIKRRDEAHKAYEDARAAGKTAALLDQERPNVFTQSVANIPPGAQVLVELVYDVQLTYDSGHYQFVYPMVVGPRYIPGTPDGKPTQGAGTSPDTDQVRDASRITPPNTGKGKRSGRNVSIAVTIDPGARIQELTSPTHQIAIDRRQESSVVEVSLARADEIPNKDFVIRYRLAGKKPAMSVLAHRSGAAKSGNTFALAFEPPVAPRRDEVAAKELYFVVDTSGSMRGQAIERARQAMRHAVRQLGPRDTFQIIRFSASASRLGEQPLANTADNVERALRYIDGLSAGGGTEMIRGVRAALDESASGGRLRIVCFLTDGFIGNEDAILREIDARLGEDTRLFALGVGASVNRHLLEEMAAVGRGAAAYLLPGDSPERVIDDFVQRIRTPVLTHVEIDWGRLEVTEQSPAKVPDVFAGQPINVVGRFGKGGRGVVTVRGRLGGKKVSYEIPVTFSQAEGKELLARLWARSRIRDLSRQMVRAQDDADLVAAITRLGLEHKLVTRYTSFVAVDGEVVVDPGSARTYMVPVDVPEGMEDAAGEGRRPVAAGASPARHGKAAADEPPNAEADYEREPAAMVLAGSPMVANRLLLGRQRIRLGAGLGLGVTSLSVDDDGSLAGAFHLRADRLIGSGFALGGQTVLLVHGADGVPSLIHILGEASALALVRGWVNLTAGVGASVSTDGDLGLGLLGAIDLRPPGSRFGVGLRFDGALGAEATRSGTGTLGIEVSF